MTIELEGTGVTPIWVRGFRVRSSMADDILRGFKNTEIIAALNAAKTEITDVVQYTGSITEKLQKSGQAWRNIKSLAACGEATFEIYRVLAYIDKASRTILAKPLYSFLSTNVTHKAYSLYRAVYEDETGSPPPVVMQETFDMYQKDHGTPVYMPSDGIPAQQFFPSTGESFHDLGYSVAHGKVPQGNGFDYSGYSAYTNRMQALYEKAADDYERVAIAAFGERNSTRKHTKWYALISTLLNFRNKGTQLVKSTDAIWNTTFKTNVRQKYLDAIRLGQGGDFIRQGRINYNEMYVAENGVTDDLDNTTGNNIEQSASGKSRMYVSSRGPFATELRADVWDALSYGAKGIVYNSIGSEGGENNGAGDVNFLINYDGPSYTTVESNPGLLGFKFGNCDHPFIADASSTVTNDVKWDNNLIEYVGNRNSLEFVAMNVHFLQYVPGTITEANLASWLNANSVNAWNSSDANRTVKSLVGTNVLASDWQPVKRGLNGCSWTGFIENIKPLWSTIDANQPWPSPRYATDVTFFARIPAFYGHKEKWEGIVRANADILPIANVLSRLEWQKLNINYKDVTNAVDPTDIDEDWQQFPIKEYAVSGVDASSQKVRRYDLTSGTKYIPRIISGSSGYPDFDQAIDGNSPYDAANERRYQLSLFKDPTDADAFYVIVANRRMWPTRFSGAGTSRAILKTETNNNQTKHLLGAVDVRRFNFTLRQSILDPQQGNEYYTVTNLRNGVEWIGKLEDRDPVASGNQAYYVDLEPGEGTIFRIARATSFHVGRTSKDGMSYNNGHRVAELSQHPNFYEPQRIVTWERDGAIQYAIVNNPDLQGEANFLMPAVGPPNTAISTTTLDNASQYYAEYPSVAVKPVVLNAKDTVAIIWSRNTGSLRNVMVSVGYKTVTSGVVTITWLGTPLQLASVPLDPLFAAHIVAPSITATRDGFFCAWPFPKGVGNPASISSAWVRWSAGNNSLSAQYNQSIAAQAQPTAALFPTVACRDEYSTTSDNARKEHIHLAWEEWESNSPIKSHIYYARYERRFPGFKLNANANPVPGNTEEIVDPGATMPQGIERVSKFFRTCEHHHPNIAVTNAWSNNAVSFGEPMVTWESTTRPCPDYASHEVVVRERYGDNKGWSNFTTFFRRKDNIPLPLVHIGNAAPGPEQEVMGVVFQDQVNQNILIQRLPMGKKWATTRLKERGQTPSVSIPYVPDAVAWMHTFAYRGSLKGEDELYDAKISARKTGIAHNEKTILAHEVKASSNDHCGKNLRFIVGGGSVGDPLAPPPGPDTNARRSIEWMAKDVSRDGFNHGFPLDRHANHTDHSIASCGWPITEDSIRTYNFTVAGGETIEYQRTMILSDSSWILNSFMQPGQFVSFEVVLKDSASGQHLMTVDSFHVSKPPGMSELLITFGSAMQATPVAGDCFGSLAVSVGDRPRSFPAPLPPSGKGYLTVRAKKDPLTNFPFSQVQSVVTDLSEVFEDMGPIETPAYKKTQPQRTLEKGAPLGLRIFPNPMTREARIELDAIAEMPTSIEVFDVSGKLVATLFDYYAPATGAIDVTLDASSLSAGNYYVRAVSGGLITTTKITIVK